MAPSIKAGLDLDWQAPNAKNAALRVLLEHMERLAAWSEQRRAHGVSTLAIKAAQAQVERIIAQDTEPDGAGGRKIREGVAPDRQISLSDPAMRHGRKSETERIDGYKEYIARDLDNDLTLAAGVLPANAPEAQGADKLRLQVEVHGAVSALYVDRAFLASAWVCELARARLDAVICRPLVHWNRGLFTKQHFTIDVAARTVRCPAGHRTVIREDKAQFAHATCRDCPQRARCQKADAKDGRTIHINPNELLLQHFAKQCKSAKGRRALRERIAVEHGLAHQRNRRGRFARYRGVAKNDFDAQRIAAVHNLIAIDRRVRRAAERLEDAA